MRRSTLLLLLIACPEPQPTQIPEPETIIRPVAVSEVDHVERSFPLPGAWVGSPQIHLANHDGFGVLVGGPTGLFRLQASSLVSVHEGETIPEYEEGAVYDLSIDGDFVWVASARGLSVYDGRLRASPVADELEPGPVLALARFDGALWIATETGVWTFDGERVRRLLDLPGVVRIIVGAQGAIASLRTGSGQVVLLKRGDSDLLQQDLGDQGHLRHVVPVSSERLFALDGGRLLVRESEEQGLVWHAVALGEAPVSPAVQSWALNAGVGGNGIWMAVGDQLGYWHEDQLQLSDLPAGLGVINAIEPVGENRVWLIGRERMVRLGSDPGPVVTFCNDIEPYFEAQCEHCHNSSSESQAVDLSSIAAWQERFDSIYSLVQAGAMPKDAAGRVDGADLYLLERWQEGGMIECDSP